MQKTLGDRQSRMKATSAFNYWLAHKASKAEARAWRNKSLGQADKGVLLPK